MKKKIIHGLLALVALASTDMLASSTSANQTFMADRGTLSNNSLISLSGRRMKKNGKDGIGAVVNAAAFYRQSYNNTKLANYFGDGTAAAPSGVIDVALDSAATTGLNSNQIDAQTAANVSGEMNGKVALNPQRIEAGAQLEWNQSLGKVVDGVWFNVAAPIVYVRTNLRATYEDAVENTLATNNGGGQGLANYFGGDNLGKSFAVNSHATATQSALANQVITPSYNSVTQVGDVKVELGYDFYKKSKNYRLGASITGLIPTGNKPAGAVAFEPVAGNRSFFLGAAVHGCANVWRSEDKKSSFGVHGRVAYSYGFNASQVRTLGLTNATSGSVADGQYILLEQLGTTNVLPTANVSTLAVNVRPGSRVEAIAGLSFSYNQFSGSLSYNLFYNQAEKLTLLDTLNTSTTSGYQVVGLTGFGDSSGLLGYSSGNTTFTANDASYAGVVVLPGEASSANAYALDLSACTTPAQVVHKLGGDVAYRFDTSVPVRIAAGAEVDLSAGNASVNSWAVFAKVGFSF